MSAGIIPPDEQVRTRLSPLGYPSNLLGPRVTYADVNESISSIVLRDRAPAQWWIGFAVAFCLLMIFFLAISWLLIRGLGIWGVNIPVAWGFAIVNFVWWIGIGHAGTFISAILLLMFQHWRTSINRLAEAMTLFAVACAGLMPLLHLGRPWVFFWLLPYPDTMGMWPQFRSPLVWDIFAVGTYFTVSILFWFLGLVPDLATLLCRRCHLLRIRHGVEHRDSGAENLPPRESHYRALPEQHGEHHVRHWVDGQLRLFH